MIYHSFPKMSWLMAMKRALLMSNHGGQAAFRQIGHDKIVAVKTGQTQASSVLGSFAGSMQGLKAPHPDLKLCHPFHVGQIHPDQNEHDCHSARY
jgi:hypothetical protein